MDSYYYLMEEVVNELKRATSKHGPMHTAHEAYAVILEEVDELWDEVKFQVHDYKKMRTEAIQIAAMCLRFIEDICDKN